MKKYYLLILSFWIYSNTFGQSTNQNYILTNVPQIAISNPSTLGSLTETQNFQTIQYFDGLGRIIQTVNKQFSPSGYDVIQPVEYDAFGRESKEYLPYTSSTADGSYHGNYQNEQLSFYSTPPTGVVSSSDPFSQNVYDKSPLNQVIEKGFAGEDWQVVYHHTLRNTNTCNQTQDSVRIWVPVVGGFGSLSGYYPSGSLYKAFKLDENSDTTIEYGDRLGHTILSEHIQSGKKLRTYYLYDDFGRLCIVITPLGELSIRHTEPFTLSSLFELANCYTYTYDARGRMVTKQIPDQDTYDVPQS